MTEVITPTKTFAPKAITDELGRRKGKSGGRARSWVFGNMLNADLQAVLDGKLVRVEFKNRVEIVGLRDAA